MSLILMIIFLICIPVVLGTRIYQLLYAIDKNTGFTIPNHLSIYILAVILIVLVAFFMVMAIKKGKEKHEFYDFFKKSYSFMAASGILSALFVAYGIVNLFSENESYKQKVFTYGFPIFALFAGGFLILLIFKLYDFEKITSMFALMSLAPVIYSALGIFNPFINATSVINISDYSYIIVYCCAIAVFFLQFAKLVCGHGSLYKTLCFAYISLLLSLVTNIAPMIAGITGSVYKFNRNTMDVILEIGIFVFLLVFAITSTVRLRKKERQIVKY